jgi:hypothetical protein
METILETDTLENITGLKLLRGKWGNDSFIREAAQRFDKVRIPPMTISERMPAEYQQSG